MYEHNSHRGDSIHVYVEGNILLTFPLAGTIVLRQLIVMEDAIGSMNMQTVALNKFKSLCLSTQAQ